MSLEPAIPEHLREKRTQPLKGEKGFQPKNVSYSARFNPEVTDLAICYFGVQSLPDVGTDDVVEKIRSCVGNKSSGCKFIDQASFIDHRGYNTVILAAYWRDKAEFKAWTQSQPEGWWYDDLSEGGPIGVFCEAYTPDVKDLETSFSHKVPEGVAHLADKFSGPTDSHEYWGSAHDRIPRGQTEDLTPEGKPRRVDLGSGLIRVLPHCNLAFIRSGQDWGDTEGKERKYYLSGIKPALDKGMKEIETEGLSMGCYFNRVLWLNCGSGEKTYSLSAWHSMAELLKWARDNKNHKAIFASRTSEYKKALGDKENSDIKLYHEVLVVGMEDQEFLYFNCHEDTGMLRALKA